jgi:hypothetical protein
MTPSREEVLGVPRRTPRLSRYPQARPRPGQPRALLLPRSAP